MGTARTPRLAIAGAIMSAALLASGQAADAHACATLTVWHAGVPTTHGPYCQALLDDWPHLCNEPTVREAGYGARPTLCLPDPPVRRHPQ